MNDKYVLCFRGENKEGKEEILKIYEASLSNIDKYTRDVILVMIYIGYCHLK